MKGRINHSEETMQLVSESMMKKVLSGERNLSLAKAKIMASRTGTQELVWIDATRAAERRTAWKRLQKENAE